SSPPFLGFLLWFTTGTYPISAFVPSRMRAMYGRVTEQTSATDSTPRPIPNVPCFVTGSDGVNGITARTATAGLYSTANCTIADPASPAVAGFDEQTNRRASGGAVLQTQIEDTRFIQGLADMAGYRGDVTLPCAGSGGGPSGSAPIMRLTGE